MTTRDTAWPAGSPAWIELSSDDLRNARTTYGHLFGWDVEDGTSDSGGYVVALKNGRSAAGIYSPDDDVPPAWLLYLASDDVEATVRSATEAGATVVVEPGDIGPTSGRFAVLQDPTGAVFGVWQGGELSGLQVVGEPGTFAWTTLLTRDLAASQTFYAAVFGYTYRPVSDDLVTVVSPGDEPVAAMHTAGELPDDAPPGWVVHFAVADRDSTVSLAEMEDGTEVLMSFDSPFGREAVLRAAGGEVLNVIELAEESPA